VIKTAAINWPILRIDIMASEDTVALAMAGSGRLC
jgi:hypothetical protein